MAPNEPHLLIFMSLYSPLTHFIRVGLYDQWNIEKMIVYEQCQVIKNMAASALLSLGLPTLEEAGHHVVKIFKAQWRVHMRSS